MTEPKTRHPEPGAAICHPKRCILQVETGNRKLCCGYDSFQVMGDGYGGRWQEITPGRDASATRPL